LDVLPHCYERGVTAVTDAIQQVKGVLGQRPQAESSRRQAFQADEWALIEQITE
jgi:hypothetical protein